MIFRNGARGGKGAVLGPHLHHDASFVVVELVSNLHQIHLREEAPLQQVIQCMDSTQSSVYQR